MDTPDLIAEIVERTWGYDQLLPSQRHAMETILNCRDSVVVLPTGGGKSLCYQAPALIREGLAIVVSPLISLMKDQVDSLQANGVAAACFNSAMSALERRQVVTDLQAGRCRILYVSPERLVGDGRDNFNALLASCSPSFVAIDEAHCISHWGHEFRPEYRRLGALRSLFPGISVHAFTATATGRVRSDIAEQLCLENPELIVGDFDRPNLVFRIIRRDNVKQQLKAIVNRHPNEAGIVYCITRKEVESLTAFLKGLDLKVVPYHAGLPAETRRLNQDEFANERADIVVATVAFGMGIDRSNVRFVVHAGAPRSIEHYQQEAGRAGRDGLEADCVLIWSGADLASWQRILEYSGDFSEEAQRHLAEMARFVCRVSCRHRALVEHFGQTLDSQNCAACDVCLGELEEVDDALILAQKILSCVVRVEQRRGVGHVIDVLRGRATDRVTSAGHQHLTTFGLLEKTPIAELRAYVEQLVEHELLTRTEGDYPVLKVSNAGWGVLKGEGALTLYRQKKPPRKKARSKTRKEVVSWDGVDHGLFELLRELRFEIASERGVPPYVIFHDTSLRDLARLRPSSVDALHSVYGVGEKKAADLGPRFLEAIAEYCEAEGLERDVGAS